MFADISDVLANSPLHSKGRSDVGGVLGKSWLTCPSARLSNAFLSSGSKFSKMFSRFVAARRLAIFFDRPFPELGMHQVFARHRRSTHLQPHRSRPSLDTNTFSRWRQKHSPDRRIHTPVGESNSSALVLAVSRWGCTSPRSSSDRPWPYSYVEASTY